MECLQNIFRNISDIFKIYLKLAVITLVIYFVAEWYILRYGLEFDEAPQTQIAAQKPRNVSSVEKLFKLMINFFIH
ncbi:uncharacterized protein LOC119663798 [Teleopsis dalmanni]|uniref:uncharacterized protein LOC119663798 n=1 Tax=Teleopsis dalmanni TaxID=139649 RepID=UPI0018CFD173|nr:uncharacterized protein LOC119663798 [Teleopsis dalmanni]